MFSLRIALQKCVRRASILGNSQICHHTSRSSIHISRLAYSNCNSQEAESTSMPLQKDHQVEMSAISGNKSAVDMVSDPEANEIPSITENMKPSDDVVNSLDTEASQSIPDIKGLNLTQNSTNLESNGNSEVAENVSISRAKDLTAMPALNDNKSAQDTANDPETGGTVSVSDNQTSQDIGIDPKVEASQSIVDNSGLNPAQDSKNLESNGNSEVAENASISAEKDGTELSKEVTQDSLQEFYSQLDKVIGCTIDTDPQTGQDTRQHAPVVFCSKEAVNRLNSEKVPVSIGSEADATPSNPDNEALNTAQSSNNLEFRKYHILVSGFSKRMTEDALRRFYSHFGEVIRCEILDGEQVEEAQGCVVFSSKTAMNSALMSWPHIINDEKVFVKPGSRQSELTLQLLNLSPKTTEESLSKFYSRFGNITLCEVKKREKRRRWRMVAGKSEMGHVAFASHQELDRALDAQPHLIDGSQVFLRYSTDELDLKVSELPEGITEESLRTFFSKYGQVRQCELSYDASETSAILSFSSLNEVKKALKNAPHMIEGALVHVQGSTSLIEKPILDKPNPSNQPPPDKVNDPEKDKNSSIPKNKKPKGIVKKAKANVAKNPKILEFRRYHICVHGIPLTVSRDFVEKFYSQFGTVIRCVMTTNDREISGLPLAIVTFSSKEAADCALKCRRFNDAKVTAEIGTYPSELSLRVQDLSPETTEESLRDFYSKFGKLTQCVVKNNPETGKLPVAYVSFASQVELDRALDAQPHLIDGSEVFLRYSTDELDLEIKELPDGITEESLRTFFSKYGHVRECKLFKGRSEGKTHAYLMFSTLYEVNRAMEDRPHIIDKKIVRTDFVGKRGLFPIFVGSLPGNATEMSLFKVFAKFGKIVHLEVRNDSGRNRRGGFGFVSYATKEEADKALENGPHTVEGVNVSVQMPEKKPTKFKFRKNERFE
ncbi:RNA recognition motif domain-containing protein [Ditylenchus destructor]|nr:RNA recognition motif domain-containing protein [Ditylenchus destructor]